MSFISNTEQDKKDMLQVVGVKDVKDLFADIPEDQLLKLYPVLHS